MSQAKEQIIRDYRVHESDTGSLGIPIQPDRSRVLRKIYRNSARVWGYAGLLLGDISKYYDESSQIQFTPKRGVDPKIVECRTLRERIEYCVRDIKEIGRNGYSWRNVMVLYNGKVFRGYQLIETLIHRLKQENIPCDWITESMESKTSFRMGRDTVKISTALSAKGLDAPKVIILNAEAFGYTENSLDQTKLMYVAMIRAREELTILHTGQEGIVPELQRCYIAYYFFAFH